MLSKTELKNLIMMIEKNILKKVELYVFTMNLNNFDTNEYDYLEIPNYFGNNFYKNKILFSYPNYIINYQKLTYHL